MVPRYFDLGALTLNNNTFLVSVISALFALWLFIYFFYPEEEENGKEKEESGAVKVEQEAVVAAVEGFDTKAFLMLLRDADVLRVSTDEEPLLLHLTLNDELTYRAESGLPNYKHPKGPLKSLKTVRLQGNLIKLEFQEVDKVMPMVFRCQRSKEIADGLASVVSALASNPFLLKKEQDSPVSFIMSPPV